MFRRAVLKAMPRRGGGHDHPDFPFLGYYQNKRIISPLEAHMWVYDGMNPEYLVDIQYPEYQLGFLVSRNFLLAWLAPFLAAWTLAVIVYSYHKRPYIPTYIRDDNDPIRKFLKRMKHEQVILNFKNPLGHSHTYINEGCDPKPTSFLLYKYTVD